MGAFRRPRDLAGAAPPPAALRMSCFYLRQQLRILDENAGDLRLLPIY